MTPEQIASTLPIILSAITPCMLTIGGAIGAIWLYWTKVYQPNQDKRKEISSTFNREQIHSSQIASQVGESKNQAALIDGFMAMSKHLIESNNGHMASLTTSVIEGFKDVISVATKNNLDATTALLDGLKEVHVKLAEQAAATNQLNYLLQARAGHSFIAGDVSTLQAAELKTVAVKRSDDIVLAVDQHIKDVAAIASETPLGEPSQNVIAIVEAKEVKE